MISYSQYWGAILKDGKPIGEGYSGHYAGLNNGTMEQDPDIGPIPRGKWRILRWYSDPQLGPVVAELVPMGHDAHGRTGFRIHGDNKVMAHVASHGCIVAPLNVREALRDSADFDLEVTQ